jgi:glycosyltransferase involved in cell wall biosynthesis
VAHSFPPRYEGIGNYCYQLSKYLAERGHQVEVFTSRLHSCLPLHEIKDGFTIHRCPYIGAIGTNRLTFMLNKILRTDADVIHAHSHIFLTSNQVALANKFKRKPFLLHLHGGLDAVPPKENGLVRFQYTVLKNLYDLTVGKWTISMADIVASVSKRDMELSKKIFGLDEHFLRWIPNAVDVQAFRPSDAELSNETQYVLFVGSLIRRKGIDVLLQVAERVFKEQPDVVFVVIGDGPLRNRFEAISNRRDLNVQFLGRVGRNTVIRWLSKASILLLPSYSEGLPTVSIEALASEVPVVATDVGGIPEVVIDGQTGYLFPSGDVQLCAEKVLKLLNNERLRRQMGRQGRNLVKRFYSWSTVLEKVEQTYESICVN